MPVFVAEATSFVGSGCSAAIAEGKSEYFNAGLSASSLAIVAGLLASTAAIGIQLQLSGSKKQQRLPTSMLPLFGALIVGVVDAFMNANLAGVGECGIASVQVCISTALLAVAALLLFCALGWLIAEHATPEDASSSVYTNTQLLVGLALLATAMGAPLLLAFGLSYAQVVTFGTAMSNAEYLLLVIPAELSVIATLLLVSRHRGRNADITGIAESKSLRRLVLVGAAGPAGLIVVYLYTAGVSPYQLQSQGQIYPGWIKPLTMASLCLVINVAVVGFPSLGYRAFLSDVRDLLKVGRVTSGRNSGGGLPDLAIQTEAKVEPGRAQTSDPTSLRRSSARGDGVVAEPSGS